MNNSKDAKANNSWRNKLNNYTYSVHKESVNTEKMLSKFVDFCGIKEAKLLDIGCGSGWFRHRIPGIKYIGLDVLATGIKNTEFPLVIGLGEDLPVRSSCVKHVLILATLDHVSNPGAVLRESFRVLDNAGEVYILSSVILTGAINKLAIYGLLFLQKLLAFDCESIARNFKKVILKKEDRYHTFSFTVDEIKRLLTNAGFSDITTECFLNTVFVKARKS